MATQAKDVAAVGRLVELREAERARATQEKDVAAIGRLVELHEAERARATQEKDVAAIGRLVELQEQILADEKDVSNSSGPQAATKSDPSKQLLDAVARQGLSAEGQQDLLDAIARNDHWIADIHLSDQGKIDSPLSAPVSAPSAGTIDVGTALGIVSSGGSVDNFNVEAADVGYDAVDADVGGSGFSIDADGVPDFSYDP